MQERLRARLARLDMTPGRRLRTLLALDRFRRMDADRPLQILDAACESGRLSLELARRAQLWQITGVDISEPMLAQARSAAAKRALVNVSFACCDLTRDLAVSRYDAIAALECLAEIPDTDAALRSLTRALRPGGLLVLHVPRADWTPVLRGSDAQWKREIHHGFEPADLVARLRLLGLGHIVVRETMHAGVQAAHELRERIKHLPLKRRLPAFPVMAGAVELERRGVRFGTPRGIWVEGRRG